MATLNAISCLDSGGYNTGVPSCFYTPAEIQGIILTPLGYKITKADMADLLTKLQTDTQADVGSRIYPFMNIVALDADNSEAAVKQTLGYGLSVIIRDGNYALSYQYLDGGLCLHKQFRMFNGKKWGGYLVDANGVILGYKNGDDLQAIPLLEFFAEKWKMSDGSNVSKFLLDLTFKPQYLNEFVGFLDTQSEFDIFSVITGLINVVVQEVTPLAAGVVKVKIVASCGGSNLYGSVKAGLTQQSAWIVTNDDTGDVVALTTAAANDADESFTLTADTADPNYPASGGKLDIRLANPSALAIAPINIVGIESNTLTETVA